MFRFTIRDVLWLMVVVALAISWWIDTKRIDKAVARTDEEHQLMMAELDDKKAELADKIEIVNDLQKRWRDSSPFAPRTAGHRLKSD